MAKNTLEFRRVALSYKQQHGQEKKSEDEFSLNLVLYCLFFLTKISKKLQI